MKQSGQRAGLFHCFLAPRMNYKSFLHFLGLDHTPVFQYYFDARQLHSGVAQR